MAVELVGIKSFEGVPAPDACLIKPAYLNFPAGNRQRASTLTLSFNFFLFKFFLRLKRFSALDAAKILSLNTSYAYKSDVV